MSQPTTDPVGLRGWAATLVGSLLALPLVLSLALDNSLNHDEHQHIAAGVLIAREGLLPYRDFAYFHVPYLAWLYGGIFRLTDHYVLASRLLSAACAALTCGAVGGAAWSFFSASSWGRRLLIAVGAIVLLITAPLAKMVGHSWNQEPSVLFVVFAFVLLLSEQHSPTARWRILTVGLLTGIAAGFRVTMLPMVLPLAIMAWLVAPPDRSRWGFLGLFAAGLSLGLLPLVLAFCSSPEGFLFGNVEFPKVNIIYRMSTGEPRTMTLFKKLRFLFKQVMLPNWLLFYGFIALVLTAKLWFKQRLCANRPLVFVLLSLPFLLMGALAPSPIFDQYFYPLAPFLVIGSAAVLAALPKESWMTRAAWFAVAGAFAISMFRGFDRYDGLKRLGQPNKWATHSMRAAAMEIRAAVVGGKVLTLEPTLPIEAGLDIYPELATGPFGWRIAPFVNHDRHRALHLLAPDDLESYLAPDPPAAILTGGEKRWEEPVTQYAVAHGYSEVSLQKGKILWLAPKDSR